jgi:hypothetical protein
LPELTSVCDTPEASADLLIARATLQYGIRSLDESVAALNAARDILTSAGIANASYVNLINSLSAVHCSMGEYAKGEDYGMQAYHLALRLDNSYLAIKATVNLCVATGRQGRYDQQEQWGWRTLDQVSGSVHYNIYMRAATYIAEAKAMLNQRSAIETYHSILDKAPATDNPWGNQAVLLNEADVWQLLGQRRKALELGRQGTTGANATVLNRGWTGKFARWVTLAAIEDGVTKNACSRIREFVDDLARQDAFDQVEIAGCFLMLNPEWSQECDALHLQTLRTIAKMPQAVGDWLQRLGIHEQPGNRGIQGPRSTR